MTILKLQRTVCDRCGSARHVPHTALMHCIRANAEEIRLALDHSKRLLHKRSELMAARHAAVGEAVRKTGARTARAKRK
jgi:hypothetical protein